MRSRQRPAVRFVQVKHRGFEVFHWKAKRDKATVGAIFKVGDAYRWAHFVKGRAPEWRTARTLDAAQGHIRSALRKGETEE